MMTLNEHMKSKHYKRNKYGHRDKMGFIATIAVVMLAYSTLALSVITLIASNAYLDSVYLYELRREARSNLYSCLSAFEQRLSRNFFLRGMVNESEFHCDGYIKDVDGSGVQSPVNMITVTATIKIGPVILGADELVEFHDYYLRIVERHVRD